MNINTGLNQDYRWYPNTWPRLNSQHVWHYLDLQFVLDHMPELLCPPGCSHNPHERPVLRLLIVNRRRRGRPCLTNEEVKLILAEAIHAVQRRGDRITQEAVRKQAAWPSSEAQLSAWRKRLGYSHWKILVEDLKLPKNS